MNYLKKLLFFSIIFTTSISQAFVSYYLLKENNKYILILGDIHRTDISEINSYHIEKFIEFLSCFKIKTPIPFILEHGFCNGNNSDVIETNTKYAQNKKSSVTITSLQNYFNQNRSILDLFYYDCRKTQSYVFYLLLDEINKLINKSQSLELFDFENFKSQIPFKARTTLKDYIIYLQLSVQNIDLWLNNWNPNSFCYKEMNNLFKNYKISVNNIMKFYENTPLDTKIDEYLINKFKDCDIIQQVAERKEKVYNLFFTDVRFGDIGFLHQLLLAQSKQPKTLLVTGNWHAKEISKSLQNIGYKLMSYKDQDPCKEFINIIRNIIHVFLTIE